MIRASGQGNASKSRYGAEVLGDCIVIPAGPGRGVVFGSEAGPAGLASFIVAILERTKAPGELTGSVSTIRRVVTEWIRSGTPAEVLGRQEGVSIRARAGRPTVPFPLATARMPHCLNSSFSREWRSS